METGRLGMWRRVEACGNMWKRVETGRSMFERMQDFHTMALTCKHYQPSAACLLSLCVCALGGVGGVDGLPAMKLRGTKVKV